MPEAPAAAFDVPAAIERLGGLRALWLKLARRYLDSAPAAQEIAQALDAGEVDVARRTAHTLKGVAATLGALNLSAQAAAVEQALAAGRLADLAPLAGADVAARAFIRPQVERP